MGFKQFQNHRLISQGCKAEYVWTKVDPSFSEDILFNSLLKMYSHFWYDAPCSRLATYYLKQKVPVFLYSFDHISENFYDYDKLIVNFVRYVNPTPENSGFAFNWTSTNAQELNYLSITDSPSMEFATAMLAFCSLFFFAILVGLACYCTRKESDDDEL
uniref:COesterase domain-containing protein n=1 Tax=Heterorhabditis bacteriophora TaxID=37862 RepID=A0A1I7X4B6_HETBA